MRQVSANIIDIKKQLDVVESYLYQLECGRVVDVDDASLYINTLVAKLNTDITELTPISCSEPFERTEICRAITRLVYLIARRDQFNRYKHVIPKTQSAQE